MDTPSEQEDQSRTSSSEDLGDSELDDTVLFMSLSGKLHDPENQKDAADVTTSFLGGCEPFSELPDSVIRVIESLMQVEEFQEGEYLFHQGEPGTALLVVSYGNVEINTVDERGQTHLITLAGPGQVLGEMALLTDEPRSANVLARTFVRVHVLPADVFHKLTNRYPAISVVLTNLVATRLGSRDRDVLAGKTLDVYRIQRRLGRGGMAVVYEAVDTVNRRRVALKMMSHRLVYDQQALAQFQREADIIESFSHENIVRMYGRFEAFRTYFTVMQYCDGETLSKVIKNNGPLPETEFRKIFGQVACALAYAHRKNIVHRDVKPGNIMFNRDGSVKLMDFGLAQPIDVGETTRPGVVAGTPRYMAPEQLAGQSVGKEADYFSMGCVAFEILCGEPLFKKSGLTRVLERAHPEEIPDIKQICPETSDDVCRVIYDCLSAEPQQRRVELDEIAAWAAPISTELLQPQPPDEPFADPNDPTETMFE